MKITHNKNTASIDTNSIESPDLAWKVLAAVARHAILQGDFVTAEKCYHQCLLNITDTYGPNDLRTGIILLELSDLRCMQNNFQGARRCNRRIRRILSNHACRKPAENYRNANPRSEFFFAPE